MMEIVTDKIQQSKDQFVTLFSLGIFSEIVPVKTFRKLFPKNKFNLYGRLPPVIIGIAPQNLKP